MLDLIISNGLIVDGTGESAYIADIGIKDGVIQKIGDLKEEAAGKTCDAAGKLVTPGFIDMHCHSESTVTFMPDAPSMVMQGVTTFVGGQCGGSLAPCDKWWRTSFFEFEQVLKLSDNILSKPDMVKAEDLSPLMEERYGYPINWQTFGGHLDVISERGFSTNYVPFVGHNAIRAQVMGLDCNRPATDDETEQMKVYLREAMDAGARGMSVGLDLLSGVYSEFRELRELALVLKEYGGIYAAHWRKTGIRQGTPKRQKKIDGIIETLEIGLQTGVQVQISHISNGYEVFPSNDDIMETAAARRTLQALDDYRRKGVTAYFDVIPSEVVGLLPGNVLSTLFHPWMVPSGSLKQFIENIKAPDYRRQITDYINSGKYYHINPARDPEWAEYITIVKCGGSNYENKTVGEIARSAGKDPVEVLFDILLADEETRMHAVTQHTNLEAVRTYINHEAASIATDTIAMDIDSIMPRYSHLPCNYPNPNTYCGFVKYLLEFPQDSIEETIKKATGFPAQILGLKDRGIIREGCKADILVINKDKLKTNEDYIETRRWPEGIEEVYINGMPAVAEGKPVRSRPGKVLRWKQGSMV